MMHPLHFAVQANNLKAIEKFWKHAEAESIDFFARDQDSYQLPQEFASPCHPIYKVVLKIQNNINAKKHIKISKKKHEGSGSELACF